MIMKFFSKKKQNIIKLETIENEEGLYYLKKNVFDCLKAFNTKIETRKVCL